ncbi:uncharacterized protein HKW66_Vig0248200 [Vigna angularis]|uniref:Uncharacterized protein n=1 Tax=Phaseolus angularis TaxID=3914 RepID=A0A8T0KTX7_PHAAN|nr:uncharacterized protein HKW66_Vig0248200 [Vigna angularis]
MSHERNSELNQWTNKKKIYKEYLRIPTRLKVYKPYLLDGLKMEEKMCAFVLTWVILPGRCLRDRLTTAELFLVHAIKTRIPTNWIAVMSEHMIEIPSSHGYILPYGVFISRVLKHHQTEFERFVVDQFRRLSKGISKFEKSLIMIHKKSDEDNALITPSASECDDEDDTTEDESMETSDSD